MTKPLTRGERRHLPSRRQGYRQKVKLSGMTFHMHTGEFDDGTLGEIWLDASKAGSSLRAMMNAFAISMSVGLQYGAPLESYIKAFKNFGFLPSGPLQGDSRFKEASSIIDYVVRELEASYLKDKEQVA